jgi:hypothetical protein
VVQAVAVLALVAGRQVVLPLLAVVLQMRRPYPESRAWRTPELV